MSGNRDFMVDLWDDDSIALEFWTIVQLFLKGVGRDE